MRASPPTIFKPFCTVVSSVIALAVLQMGQALAVQPFFEETFNQGGINLDFKDGAGVGLPGSGVSEKTDDLSYESGVIQPDMPAPFAKVLADLPSSPLDEFTVTFWYKMSEMPEGIASVFNSHGIVVFWGKDKWVFRVNGGSAEPYYSPGAVIDPVQGQWKFLACTWTRAEYGTNFYTGDKTTPTELAGSQFKKGDAPQLTFGDPDRPRTIGNTFVRSANEPFPGNIDNLRFYDKALDATQIEKIRQADIENKEPDLK